MKQNIEQLNKVFDKNFKYLEKEIGTPDYEDLKLFMRSEMEEILDEAIGEEKEETCDCGGTKNKHEVIGCNGDLHLTEYEEGYNDKRAELLSLKLKL